MAEEKMVPLDVTGNPVEVTLKDENPKEEIEVAESNVKEIVEEAPQEVKTKEEEKVETKEEEKTEAPEDADPYITGS
jgi:F0F1-type ATP synthase membrane subunit b/b'